MNIINSYQVVLSDGHKNYKIKIIFVFGYNKCVYEYENDELTKNNWIRKESKNRRVKP